MTGIRLFEIVLLPPLWALTLHTARKARAARGTPDAAPTRLLAGVVGLITLSVTVGVPAVRRVIDATAGVQSVTNVLAHLLGMAAITCLTGFVRHLSGAPEPRRPWLHRLPLPLAGTALATAFAAGTRPDGEQHLLTDGSSAAHQAYWAVYLAYVMWGVTSVGLMCLRHRRHAPPGPLRTSLNLLGSGTATAVAYAVHRCAYLAARDTGWWLFRDGVVVPTTQVLLAASLLLYLAGISWPALAEWRAARASRRRLRTLEPLWRAVCGVVPEVVLPLPQQLRATPDVLLYRYVIEISDGLLALGPYRRDTETTEVAEARERLAAAGLTGRRLEAAAEAVAVRRAVEALAAGHAPLREPAGTPQGAPDESPAEALELLAEYYGHPLVRAVARTPLSRPC
ncbi:MAB_1171c family putative transporter [Streptomyces sp. NPDC048603]|uniref:MAB_1171c family putative transporter n=1 Tax=Streptomyces sp. NPDC048603 TaxID=3365577 RepID=UPI0037148578